jgi:hypothetical protein
MGPERNCIYITSQKYLSQEISTSRTRSTVPESERLFELPDQKFLHFASAKFIILKFLVDKFSNKINIEPSEKEKNKTYAG